MSSVISCSSVGKRQALPILSVVTALVMLASAEVDVACQSSHQDATGQPNTTNGWSVAFFIGGDFPSTSPRGRATQLPPGATVPLDFPSFPQETIVVSSWFAGDAPKFIDRLNSNHLLAASGIASLDPVLYGESVRRNAGFGAGARLTRRLSNRFAAEISLGLSNTTVSFTGAALANIEKSRDSFQQFFTTAFGGLGDQTVVGAATTHQTGSRTEIVASLAVQTTLAHVMRGTLYGLLGGAAITESSPTHAITLVGHYTFDAPDLRLGTVHMYDETDTVTLETAVPRLRPALVTGAEWDRSLSRHISVRADARILMSPTHVTLTFTAVPHSVLVNDPQLQHTGILTIGTAPLMNGAPPTPVLSFDDNVGLSSTFPSTLSGPPINGFRTFVGNGTQFSFSLSAGLSYRF